MWSLCSKRWRKLAVLTESQELHFTEKWLSMIVNQSISLTVTLETFRGRIGMLAIVGLVRLDDRRPVGLWDETSASTVDL
jgi:hypothetical protein